MRIALLSSHALHDRNWICSGMTGVLRTRGHEVHILVAGRPRFGRVRASLRLATMVAREPQSQTYRHKATLLRGGRRLEAAVWRLLARRGVDVEALACRLEARLARPWPFVREALGAARPDVFVWPTLVHMDAVENDWIWAARALGVPVVGAVASWDNLTTKGAFLVRPDRLLVWGEASRRHAVELHGFAPEHVAAPGPPHFAPYEDGPIPQGKEILVAGTSLHYWHDEDAIIAKLRRVAEVRHRPHPRRRGGWDPDIWSVRRDLEPAAFIIAAFSTVIIEAALLGRPAILIAFGVGDQGAVLQHEKYDHMREVAAWPSSFVAHSEMEMLARVWGLSRNPLREVAQRAVRMKALEIANCAPGIQARVADAIEAAR